MSLLLNRKLRERENMPVNQNFLLSFLLAHIDLKDGKMPKSSGKYPISSAFHVKE